MRIDENTKVIGRFHKQVSPRGLNIYNPFFQENNINAVFLLFNNENPKVLIDGYRSLALFGAITAGFESDSSLPTLIDEVDDNAKYIGRIGYLSSENGQIIGHAQGGQGMLRTVKRLGDLQNKKIVIVGAGNVAKGLLFNINKEKIKCSVDIYNKSIEKAEILKNDFDFVENIHPFEKVENSEGDIFVNLTHIGGKVQDISFSDDLLSRFKGIVDVTFEAENTKLIESAKRMNKKYATGWDMFTNQGLVILEDLFKQKFDFDSFKKHVVNGLSQVVK